MCWRSADHLLSGNTISPLLVRDSHAKLAGVWSTNSYLKYEFVPAYQISTLGLMQSIAYCQIRLVNRKTATVAKMTLHVGISSKLEAGEYMIPLSCDSLRLRCP
jgi:hypothetical protein